MKLKTLRRALSALLAVMLFVITPLSDYSGACSSWASLVATESDAEEVPEVPEMPEMPEFPEITDSVTDELLEEQFQRYDQSLIDYPETLIGKSPYSRIALADDAVIILTALLSLVGVYIANTIDLTAFITTFEIWLRQMYGNVPEIMQVWQAILNPVDTVKITGLKVFLPVLWKYMKDKVNGYGSGSTDLSVDDKNIITEAFYPLTDLALSEGAEYRFSLAYNYQYSNSTDKEFLYSDIYFPLDSDLSKIIAVRSSSGSDYSFRLYTYNSVSDGLELVSFYLSQLVYNIDDDVYSYPNHVIPLNRFSYSSNRVSISDITRQFPFLVFKDTNYALSYFKSGTMGGLISGKATSITVDKAWSQLQQDALDRFGDTLTIPSPESWQEIQSRLESSATADDVLSALGTIFEINPSGGGGTVSIRPFVDLSYLLDAVAVYAGATALTADQRTAFLKDYLKLTVEGGTVEQLNQWATTVLLSQVTITGTDTNNDNNSFVISSALATALLSYLVTIGLLDAAPSIAVGAQITANIRVGEKTVNPDVPGTDLTGILSIIKAILAALGGLPALIATEVISALASSAFANGITLSLDTIRSAIGEIAQWDFADWSTALGASMLLALNTFAIDLGLDGVSSALDRIAQWDFADWDKIFGALDSLLPMVGINADIWDLTKTIAQWDFADWSSTLGTVLSGALAASGLSSLLGVLQDILNGLLGLDINLDVSGLLASLTDILNAILAIPGSIEAFFAIDQVAIEAAYVSLSTTFQNRFSGLNQLGAVFTYTPRSFDDTPPVFTMKVPDFLKFAIEEEEMVIADLRPFKDYFDIARNILTAILWFLFALWVLEQFDVKFRM